MEIKTSYCLPITHTPPIYLPITLVNKEVLPNYDSAEAKRINDLRDVFCITEKTAYKIKWLTKYDKEFKPGFAEIEIDGRDTYPIKLNSIQQIKLKIVWREYWVLKRENFRDFIFPFITGSFGATLGFIAGYIIKAHSCK